MDKNQIVKAFATVHADALYSGSYLYPEKHQEVIDKLNEYDSYTLQEIFDDFVVHFVEGNYDLEGHDEYGLYAMNPEWGADLSEHPRYEELLEEMEDYYAAEIVLPVVEQTLALTAD